MNITTLPRTLNRDAATGAFQIPADGWMQLVPLGRISAPMEMTRGGRIEEVQITQDVTPATINRLAAAFQASAAKPNFPGVLVDFDHFSNDTEKSSRAAAWIEEVAARDDGLWGRVRFSASGKAAVEGGDYRLFSPVLGFPPRAYNAGEIVEPAVLLRGALTNDPRYKGMVPVSNRDNSPLSATENQTITTMKELLIKLLAALDTTVPADAKDDAFAGLVDTAITNAAKNKAEADKMPATLSRIGTLEAELVEHDLDKAKLQGDARAEAKKFLTKNRVEGLAFITALGADGSGYAVTHNRGTAKTPNAPKSDDATAAANEVRAAKISCRAREIRAAKPSTSLSDAYATAASEIDAASSK